MGGQMHPCFYQCKIPCRGLYSSGAETRWTIASSNKGTYMAARQSCSQRPSRATAVPWKRSLSERTNQREEYQRQPQGGKAGPRHNRGVCLQRQQRPPEGEEQQGEKAQGRGNAVDQGRGIRQIFGEPGGKQGSQDTGARRSRPGTRPIPPPATGRPAPRRRRRRRQWSKAISPATPATGGRPGPRDRPFCPER